MPSLGRSSSPPKQIPFPPLPENQEKLENWILSHYSSSAFNTCPHQALHTMSGRPMSISFCPDATPLEKSVKADLDRDVALGIIEPVPQGTPTIWCLCMVVTPKKDGTPRRTIDLQKLNQATLCETHHTPLPFNQVSAVPPNTKKTVLDGWNGCHSLPLSPDARDAITFITEWGRYRYLWSPMGFQASSDAYTKRFDDIMVDCPRKAHIIDDTILWDSNLEDSLFKFGRDEVDFSGFNITKDGIKHTSGMIDTISSFPTPQNITGIHSWFGLVNQVAYAFAQAEVMALFRELLSTKNQQFYWDEALESAFQQSKQKIVEMISEGVRSFKIDQPTCICSDWSKTGIRFFLRQQHCTCPTQDGPECGDSHWKLIFAGSRFTSDAKSRYAPIEGEALALIYALESCRMFVLGCPNLIISVDHKPLVPIFSDRAMEKNIQSEVVQLQRTFPHVSFHHETHPGQSSHWSRRHILLSSSKLHSCPPPLLQSHCPACPK